VVVSERAVRDNRQPPRIQSQKETKTGPIMDNRSKEEDEKKITTKD